MTGVLFQNNRPERGFFLMQYDVRRRGPCLLCRWRRWLDEGYGKQTCCSLWVVNLMTGEVQIWWVQILAREKMEHKCVTESGNMLSVLLDRPARDLGWAIHRPRFMYGQNQWSVSEMPLGLVGYIKIQAWIDARIRPWCWRGTSDELQLGKKVELFPHRGIPFSPHVQYGHA